MAEVTEVLKFKEYSLHIDAAFWFELERRKLHEWRLDEPWVPLTAWTSSARRLPNQLPGLLSVTPDSFQASPRLQHHSSVPAQLLNFNTVEQLQNLDKRAALHEAGKPILDNIESGNWAGSGLTRLVLYTFSDLKTHKFSYIAAVPVIDPGAVQLKSSGRAVDIVGQAAIDLAWRHAQATADESEGSAPFVLDGTAVKPFGASSTEAASSILCFIDSSNVAEYPGWPLRNLLAAVRLTHPSRKELTVVALRESPEASVAFVCRWEAPPAEADPLAPASASAAPAGSKVRTVGWVETKIRTVDMSAQMDPTRLADSSASLNLGLMKWRMMPNLELDALKECKALLLGSGTLGCNIARHLMMWGVRHITLVDRGAVSYSNPVRQTLFELSDCVADGPARVKSVAAANALKRILPTVNATGVELTIRMPGHRVDDSQRENAASDIQRLESLIRSHDVTFLLTDSRESRWLPTLLATFHDKPLINSALGFDTYVVMRHGLRAQDSNVRVGCYFCNDVIAPIDSLTARTLDQQCTVTRPGVSGIASAIAVELLAAAYNHPEGFLAPAYRADDDGPQREGHLGILPHQIRGSVADYSTMTLRGPNYTLCTACSDAMVERYRQGGTDFIIECLNRPELMEEVTGLKAEKERAKEKFANWDDADFDD